MDPAEELNREIEMFKMVASRLLNDLAAHSRILLTEDLFLNVYPELRDRMRRERGWWNPLVNPHTIFHFYGQAVMIVSPARDEEEFTRLHNITPRDASLLAEEGLLVLILSSLHTHYTCPCYDRLLEAQGVLPTILRLTETMKALLVQLRGDGLWSTKTLYYMLPEQLDDETRRDLATRISDLATIGYRTLAEDLLKALIENPTPEVRSLIRSLHHILVEPIIDSGATIGVFSTQEVDYIENLLRRGNLRHEHLSVLASLLWSLKAPARLVVPRRTSSESLIRIAHSEKLAHIHTMVADYRKTLASLDRDPNAIEEAGKIARTTAGAVEQANRTLHTTGPVVKKAARLGFISQIPAAALLAQAGPLTENILADAILSTIIGVASGAIPAKILEHLLSVEDHIYILPVTPTIYERG